MPSYRQAPEKAEGSRSPPSAKTELPRPEVETPQPALANQRQGKQQTWERDKPDPSHKQSFGEQHSHSGKLGLRLPLSSPCLCLSAWGRVPFSNKYVYSRRPSGVMFPHMHPYDQCISVCSYSCPLSILDLFVPVLASPKHTSSSTCRKEVLDWCSDSERD